MGMNKNTEHPEEHAQASPAFPLQHFGTGFEMKRTFHCRHAVSIKTTRRSRKDCSLATGIRKAAGISKPPHTHVGSSKYCSIELIKGSTSHACQFTHAKSSMYKLFVTFNFTIFQGFKIFTCEKYPYGS